MATTTLLSGANVTVGAVSVSDNLQSCVIEETIEALENTSLQSAARTYTSGLQAVTVTLELFNAYGTGSIEATLAAQLGTSITIVAYGTNSATVGVGNPKFSCASMFLESVTPINSAYGALQMVTAVYKGGPLTRTIA